MHKRHKRHKFFVVVPPRLLFFYAGHKFYGILVWGPTSVFRSNVGTPPVYTEKNTLEQISAPHPVPAATLPVQFLLNYFLLTFIDDVLSST